MSIIDSAAQAASEAGRIRIDDLLVEMDAWDVSHALLSPPDEFIAVYNREGNRQIVDITRLHPDRVSGLAVANPWYGEMGAEFLREAFRGGLAGLYVHAGRQGFHLTDAIIDPLIEVCIEFKKNVYCYTGTPVCCEPFQLAELARRHPDVLFVLGHSAWSDFAGYDVVPAARQAPNMFIETSCSIGGMVRQWINDLGADRVMFGSAYPRSRYKYEVEKITELDLRPDIYTKLMRTNAEHVWKLGAP